jgi:sulfate transport system ATP-binding protein
MDISVKNIRKEFRSQTALADVSLDIKSGELIALLGPSGSGKTTLLRLIAGLEFPSRGSIFFGDTDASRRSVQERHVGFVFQNYALFKHMTVFDNIAFGLNVRPRAERPGQSLIAARVEELLDLVQLQGLEKRYPSQLSGGQRQRVALARALAIDPTVLLLDEPFGALDAKVRKDLRRWLRELHDKTHHTTIFVTHDQEEALELADRVVVMSNGRIEQTGSPDEVYSSPATPYVYEFLGATNMFPVLVKGGLVYLEGFMTSFAGAQDHTPDGPASLYVRPHDIDLTDDRQHGIPGIIQSLRQAGGNLRIEVRTPTDPAIVTVEVAVGRYAASQLDPGSRILLRPRKFGLFPRSAAVPVNAAINPASPRLSVVSS